MTQAEIFQNMTKHTAFVKIELSALNESDAFDGIASILNDALYEGKILDWSYAEIKKCTCEVETVSVGEERIDVDVPQFGCPVHGVSSKGINPESVGKMRLYAELEEKFQNGEVFEYNGNKYKRSVNKVEAVALLNKLRTEALTASKL